jgi:hypothetical protein
MPSAGKKRKAGAGSGAQEDEHGPDYMPLAVDEPVVDVPSAVGQPKRRKAVGGTPSGGPGAEQPSTSGAADADAQQSRVVYIG